MLWMSYLYHATISFNLILLHFITLPAYRFCWKSGWLWLAMWPYLKYLGSCAFFHVPVREVSEWLCFPSRACAWSIWVVCFLSLACAWSIWMFVLSFTCLCGKYLGGCAFFHVPVLEVCGWFCFPSRACAWSISVVCFLSLASAWNIWMVVLSFTCLCGKYLGGCAFFHVPLREVSEWLCLVAQALSREDTASTDKSVYICDDVD